MVMRFSMMAVVLLVSDICCSDFSAANFLVFSAPRYCDSTENRGAYINIGPDYKLKYEQFDAVPHPDIKPMAYAQSSLMSSLM